MWPALGELVEEPVDSRVGQVALAVAASTTWVATRASPSVWLVAPWLVALGEDVAAVAVALGVAMEVALVVAWAKEWEVVSEGLVALEGLVVLVELVDLVGPVALALVAALGESRK